MTKPIATFFFSFFIWCAGLNGQCSVANPLQGLTIDYPTFLCGSELDGYTGKLPPNNSPLQYQPDPLCDGVPNGGGQPDNILWFSFIATSFTIDIDIHYFNCNEPSGTDPLIQVGIYSDQDFNEILTCASQNGLGGQINLSSNSAIPGKEYYLFIDGYSYAGLGVTSTCDFRIEVNSGVNTNPYIFDYKDDISAISAVEEDGLTQGLAEVCAGNGIVYTYQAPVCEASAGSLNLPSFEDLELFCYEWTITPAGSGVIVGDQNSRTVDIDWQVPGDYTLSVEIFPLPELTACSPDICTSADDIQISSTTITGEIRDTIYFCAQDPPLFCGDPVTETQTLRCIEDNSNCIEVEQPFVLLENDTIDYGVFVNCGNNNCFNLFGFEYCQPGNYVFPDIAACNVFHKVSIEGIAADINLPSRLELNCDNGNLILNPNVNTNYNGAIVFEWYKDGQLVGTEEDLEVDGTGDYEFVVNFPDLGSDCGTTHQIEIAQSMDAPEYQLTIPELNCNASSGSIEFIEIDAITSVEWSGPNGFTSTASTFSVDEGGEYTLTVIGANGCLSDSTFSVIENFESPSISLNVEDLNCIVRNTQASFSSDNDIANVQWQVPGGSVISSDSILIDQPGDYELTVYGTNGCTTIQPFTIEENLEAPVVDAGEDMVWQCNTESLMIEASVSAGPHELYWSFIEEGQFLTDRTQPTVEVASEGTYILMALNFESGCETSDSVIVVRNENVPDSMEIVKVDPSCFESSDGMIQIVNVNGGTEPYRYFVNGSSSEDDFFDNLAAGVYSLMVLDDYDCRLVVDVDVEEQSEISLDQMPTNLTIGYNEWFTFYALHNLADGEVQMIQWFDENGNLIGEADSLLFQTDVNTSISVEVTNTNGCSSFRSIPIEVDFDFPVYAPNVFSPNEDGFNDYFTLFKRDDYPSEIKSLSIFNRWGEQVFHKRNFNFDDESAGWDGRKNGQMLQNAVFTYTAVVTLVDGQEKLIRGEVTLIR